jgi:hypothetical protein
VAAGAGAASDDGSINVGEEAVHAQELPGLSLQPGTALDAGSVGCVVEEGRGGEEEGATGAGAAAGGGGGEERMAAARSVALTGRREAHPSSSVCTSLPPDQARQARRACARLPPRNY